MNRIIKYFLGIVIIAMLLFSIFYINNEHEYDLTLPDEVTTDENYIDISYKKEEPIEDESVLGILEIDKIDLKATVKE